MRKNEKKKKKKETITSCEFHVKSMAVELDQKNLDFVR